ncbi:MAG: hopanoid biosynthesis-associated transporter HpnN [Betaproteobacteria bacterium]|nr:hopanoid biosynthesis-associated transporter HpnN [Betaproteobacteria bacterium]
MQNAIGRVVAFCSRYARPVIALWMIGFAFALTYVATHFAINTDTSQLISADLAWRQREIAFDKAFPQRSDLIAIVIDGETPEIAERAAATLTKRLAADTANFKHVWRPDGGEFFERNGLLFLPLPQLQQTLDRLIAAQPLLGPLAADPSLRGLMNALALMVRGAAQAEAPIDDLARPLSALADTLEAARMGQAAPLAWRSLMTGQPPDPRELRRFVLVHPVLDYGSLEPGERATHTIRQTAADAGLTPANGARVRLTGQVPLADEEFATLKEGLLLSATVTVVLVALLLWLALRSGRIIAAILISLFAGLVLTAGLGLALVGAFNPISIAFGVLFVGLGVDFGIQLSMSYRSQRFAHADLHEALREAGARVGGPLALAATSTALGFLAFLPTAYRGVAELGLIAGSGMLIAFAASTTLLPALLRVLKPPGEPASVGFAALASLERLVRVHHRRIVASCVLITIAGAAVLPQLRFDFNLLNLRSHKVESVATLLDLARDPQTTPNTIDVLAPDLDAADALARKLSDLPEVAQTLTLSSFVPEAQDAKLALINDAALLLGPALVPSAAPPPGDAENVSAMIEAGRALEEYATARSGAAAVQAKRLAAAATALALGDPGMRERAHAALIPGLQEMLAQLRNALSPTPVTRESLPQDLVRDWIAPDGRARIEVRPAGDSTDNTVLRRFVEAVRGIAPDATGAPVTMYEAGRAIATAFIQAGAWAALAITIVLIVVLRRASDVLLTLAPLLLSGVLTLALCVVIGLPLNYANIIALPLLFGIGVSFNIYFVMAWRGGAHDLLTSSLARAVIFSAVTTASAFGSLWLSSHPGTASMGELLALSLVCTLASALVFLPALLAFKSP